MAIRIFCDSCGQEPKGSDFMFDAQVKEMVSGMAFNGKKFSDTKQMQTKVYQLCQKCYNDKFLGLIQKNVIA